MDKHLKRNKQRHKRKSPEIKAKMKRKHLVCDACWEGEGPLGFNEKRDKDGYVLGLLTYCSSSLDGYRPFQTNPNGKCVYSMHLILSRCKSNT